MGKLDGKVAFITGAARGQGRAHAVKLASEGADIIAIDVLEHDGYSEVKGTTWDDLDETVRQVEALDRRIIASKADVRRLDQLQKAVDEGVAELGRLDIVVANAGIIGVYFAGADIPEEQWTNMIDVNLNGVWRTARVAIPHIRAGGRGGSIVLTGSVASARGVPGLAHYGAAKHGVVGLMKTLAIEYAGDGIRVNAVLPGHVNTPLIETQQTYKRFRPDLDRAVTKDEFMASAQASNLLHAPWLEPEDVANAVLFLASDDSRLMTGQPLAVDIGALVR